MRGSALPSQQGEMLQTCGRVSWPLQDGRAMTTLVSWAVPALATCSQVLAGAVQAAHAPALRLFE